MSVFGRVRGGLTAAHGIAIVTVAMMLIACSARPAAANEGYPHKGKAVIAHRGASGYLPEHTLEAYALAYGQGADYLEPDLNLTKDGVPIALHDRTLDTMTNVAEVFPGRARRNGRHFTIDFTLEEIRQLTVRERVNLDTGERVYANRFPSRDGELRFRIATLAEIIELVQGLNASTGRQVGLYPEIKSSAWHREQGYDFERIVFDVFTEYGYRTRNDPVMIQAFDPESLTRLRAMGCELRLVQLVGTRADEDPLVTPEGIARIARYADGIGPSINRLIDAESGRVINNNALVRQAHHLGLVVHPWTIRKDSLPEHAQSVEALTHRLLFELNVDGVFTDHPDEVIRAIERHGNDH